MNTNRIVLSGAVVLSLLLSACGTKKIRYNDEKAPVRVATVSLDEKKLVVGTHYAHYDDFIACRATVQAEIALLCNTTAPHQSAPRAAALCHSPKTLRTSHKPLLSVNKE